MTEAKHTRGPWKVGDSTEPHDKRLWIQCKGNGHTIARMADAGQKGKANACLIAAAPDMLEALRAMQEMFEALCEKIDWGSSFLGAKEITLMNEAPIKARSAITKATEGE